MNREVRRRQNRQERLARNAERAARKPAPAPSRSRIVAAPPPSRWGRFEEYRVLTAVSLISSGVILLIAVAVWFFFMRGPDTSGLAIITAADQGRAHLQAGETNPNYNTNPPTSGAHAPSPVLWGVYTESNAPTKEELVHNMEHGGVIVWYDPSKLTADQVDELTRTAAGWLRDRKKVIVVPWKTSIRASPWQPRPGRSS